MKKIILALFAVTALAFSACSTTQTAKVNAAASTIAKDAAAVQSALATNAPVISNAAANTPGLSAKTQKQISAVTADAAAYAADAQLLAQIVATFTTPITSGT